MKIDELTKEELANIYATHSTIEMGKMLGCNPQTVANRLAALGIPRRPSGGRRKFMIDPAVLDELYQTKSLREIADQFRVGQTVVFKRIQEFGIKLRDEDAVKHRRQKGKTFTEAHRKALSIAKRGKWVGPANPNWKGGAAAANLKARGTGEYKQWKNAVLQRAGYKCQSCGVAQHSMCECCGTEIQLHVHHVKSFADNPALRFDETNGEVLCPKCHYRHHRKTG